MKRSASVLFTALALIFLAACQTEPKDAVITKMEFYPAHYETRWRTVSDGYRYEYRYDLCASRDFDGHCSGGFEMQRVEDSHQEAYQVWIDDRWHLWAKDPNGTTHSWDTSRDTYSSCDVGDHYRKGTGCGLR